AEAGRGTDLRFQLEAARAGDVARWLGLARDAAGRVAIEGEVRVGSDEWRLSPFSVRLGNTTMNAELALASLSQRPVFQARVVVDNLDLDELEHMLPPSDPNAPVTPSIDLPILPHGISLFDADIDVQLKHIAMQPAPVNDVSFSGRIRDG